MTEEPRKIGETWTNIYNGRVYRWDGEKWVWTGETIPIPHFGEFP